MAHVVVLGSGIGGVPMALETKQLLKKGEEITVISNSPTFQFVPSNPWLMVGWRKTKDIVIDLVPVFKKKKINFITVGAKKSSP